MYNNMSLVLLSILIMSEDKINSDQVDLEQLQIFAGSDSTLLLTFWFGWGWGPKM